ncbi:hypothetical protein L218DRAFT_1082236 [Marasmius fiardii PR-910]|nr:hypothetical protein L218DRAFT_1082236 [Marasmius fiardii PR-910]
MSVNLNPSSSLVFYRLGSPGFFAESTLTITNPHNRPVAFKVLATSTKSYGVRPNLARVEPGQSTEVTVKLQVSKEEPLDTECKHKFLIQSTFITPEREQKPLSKIVWSAPEPTNNADTVHQQKLKVEFLEVKNLSKRLQSSLAEIDNHRVVQDELKAEVKQLERQLDELVRESLNLPLADDDEDLQILINEDMSRENSNLQVRVQELSDSVSRLQGSSEGWDAQRQMDRATERENQQLRRRVQQLEDDSSTQTQLRTQAEELLEENRQLRQELDAERSRNQTRHTGRRHRSADDVPPPTYEEIDTT